MTNKKMLVINADEATDDMFLPAILKNPDGTCVAITPDGERQDCKDFDQASRIIYNDSWVRDFEGNGTIRNGELACRYTFEKIDNIGFDLLIGKYFNEDGAEIDYAIYDSNSMTAYPRDSEVEMFLGNKKSSKEYALSKALPELGMMTKEGLIALIKFIA